MGEHLSAVNRAQRAADSDARLDEPQATPTPRGDTFVRGSGLCEVPLNVGHGRDSGMFRVGAVEAAATVCRAGPAYVVWRQAPVHRGSVIDLMG